MENDSFSIGSARDALNEILDLLPKAKVPAAIGPANEIFVVLDRAARHVDVDPNETISAL